MLLIPDVTAAPQPHRGLRTREGRGAPTAPRPPRRNARTPRAVALLPPTELLTDVVDPRRDRRAPTAPRPPDARRPRRPNSTAASTSQRAHPARGCVTSTNRTADRCC